MRNDTNPSIAPKAVIHPQPRMTTERKEERGIASPLTHRVGPDADPAQIAQVMATICQEIATALTPIIGPRGVVALYERSLHLSAAKHPWLLAARTENKPTLDSAALKAVLSQQSSTVAAAGGNTLLEAFYALLTSLVGRSLTERLLRTVWVNPTSGSPAQDPST
jgi:hypothetical protein